MFEWATQWGYLFAQLAAKLDRARWGGIKIRGVSCVDCERGVWSGSHGRICA